MRMGLNKYEQLIVRKDAFAKRCPSRELTLRYIEIPTVLYSNNLQNFS